MNLTKNKIHIFGSTGMIGHMLYKRFSESGLKVYGYHKTHIDASQNSSVIQKDLDLLNLEPKSTIINCIGSIPQHNNDRKLFWTVNTLFPLALANYCTSHNINLIHISTNHVFNTFGQLEDGFLRYNFVESDRPKPASDYGESKLRGEPKDHFTIRGCFVGPEVQGRKYNLYQWLLSQPKKTHVQGYLDSYFNPITTLELANFIMDWDWNNPQKLLHVHSPHIMPKYSFLKYLSEEFNLELTVEPVLKVEEDATISSDYTKITKTIPQQLKELKKFYYA